MKSITVATLVALVGLTVTTVDAQAQQWGTVKGQVIWGADKLPERKPLNVDKDKPNCLRDGPILEETYVVDSKTKGIRSVMIWLVADNGKGEADPKGKLPIHPALTAVKPEKVSLDQPCCMFIPQVIGVREGQIFEAKNSDKIPHNTNIIGGANNPNENFLLPPGTSKDVKGWKAAAIPVPISCSIHPWMKSYVRVFNHPYYVVTGEDGKFEIKNAPAGKFRLVVWHPEGYMVGNKDKHGIEVKIDGGKTTDLGELKYTPEK